MAIMVVISDTVLPKEDIPEILKSIRRLKRKGYPEAVNCSKRKKRFNTDEDDFFDMHRAREEWEDNY